MGVMQPLVEALFDYVRESHPRSLRGIEEARAVAPHRFDDYANLLLGWAEGVLGDGAVARTVDAFVRFSFEINMAQGRYEATGHYESKTYEQCYDAVYNQQAAMDDYLWGVYLTSFLWAHHVDLSMFFEDRFVARLPHVAEIVEIASGHGGWGLIALHRRPGVRLTGFDISPSSVAIAQALAEASGHADRVRYVLKDALELPVEGRSADACICNFLVEHLEQPERLFAVIRDVLRPGARAFITGALTAAQVDHIHEFRRESELVLLAEDHGMRVLETLSVGPQRTLPGARFLPRSMALIVQKRSQEPTQSRARQGR